MPTPTAPKINIETTPETLNILTTACTHTARQFELFLEQHPNHPTAESIANQITQLNATAVQLSNLAVSPATQGEPE